MRLATKATHQQTRALNQGLVLRTIYDLGPISRAEIARVTELTRTSVSDLVGDAIAEGLVEEVGRGPSSGGKAPILVQVVEDAKVVIGLDLGEQAFAGALVDLRGGIQRRIDVPVEGRDGKAALGAVERLVDELVAAAPPGRPPRIRGRARRARPAWPPARHGGRAAGPRRPRQRRDPLGGDPRRAGPATGPDPQRAH